MFQIILLTKPLETHPPQREDCSQLKHFELAQKLDFYSQLVENGELSIVDHLKHVVLHKNNEAKQ